MTGGAAAGPAPGRTLLRRPGGLVGPVALTVVLAAVSFQPAPAEARTGAVPALLQDAPPPAPPGDTVRARILERLRGPAPEPADTAAADTIPPSGDTVRIEAGPRRPTRRAELPPGADSVMRALAELPGYEVSTYQATRADFQARDGVMVLQGTPEAPARFHGRGVVVEADSSITWDDRVGRVRTVGPTLLIPEEGDRVLSRSLVYDLTEERGSALGAQTTYEQGGRWIVQGDLTSVRETEVFGRRTRFTSCDLDPPHSYFEASQFKVIRDRVLVARSIQFYVEDVPVAWLPFMAQNLGSGRASGLLSPTFSMNDVVRTSTGYSRRISNIGYYWAMSPYSDMTVAMDWWSNNYTALTGSVRYRWNRQFLDGNLDFRNFWRESGGRDLTLSTRHSWVASERTRLRANASYASSTAFVRQNTFDPRELNQTINSDAGLTHRFDWGQLSLGANRRQYLNDDRVDMTLPSANLSLSTITLFGAPPQQASWYNNISLSGAMGWTRDLQERELQADSVFSFARTSNLRTRGNARGSLGLGRLSLSGNLNLDEREFQDVPARFLPDFDPDDPLQDDLRGDLGQAELGWSTSLSFQQRLIGSTTFTPSLSVDGRLARVDSIPVAQDYVAGPARVRFGAGIQTDLYGFYPGFGSFEAIRHKVTPSLRWSYAPAVTPTELQERVFGIRDAQVQNQFSFGFNQTWEARLPAREQPDRERQDEAPPRPGTTPAPGEPPPGDEPPEPAVPDPDRVPTDPEEARARPAPPGEIARDTVEILRRLAPDEEPEEEEEVEERIPPAFQDPSDQDGPRRLPESRVVTLLALQTNAVNYDVLRRDETGRFIDGFTTTTLSNSVRSDFLHGLSLSFQHDLFDDRDVPEGGRRQFSPHLSQMALSFSLNQSSSLVRLVGGLLGRDEDEGAEPEVGDQGRQTGEQRGAGPGADGRQDGFDPNRMMPDAGDPMDADPVRMGATGQWNARISYSLRRPRGSGVGSALRAQMIQTALSFRPSENWDASWSTSYDVEAGRFNDHVVSLRRDLHEWEATFSFRQTATGNWSFNFEVSLRANRDLRVDFDQRSLDGSGVAGGAPSPF
jgi:hypothetical protein